MSGSYAVNMSGSNALRNNCWSVSLSVVHQEGQSVCLLGDRSLFSQIICGSARRALRTGLGAMGDTSLVMRTLLSTCLVLIRSRMSSHK